MSSLGSCSVKPKTTVHFDCTATSSLERKIKLLDETLLQLNEESLFCLHQLATLWNQTDLLVFCFKQASVFFFFVFKLNTRK